jgi:hypothetical protein
MAAVALLRDIGLAYLGMSGYLTTLQGAGCWNLSIETQMVPGHIK